jgi:hypothetical protein
MPDIQTPHRTLALRHKRERISAMRAVLEDEVPEVWLSDTTMKDYKLTVSGLVTSSETSLSEAKLHKDGRSSSGAFHQGLPSPGSKETLHRSRMQGL